MTKILIVDKCSQCKHFEANMYHGNCCWHEKVIKKVKDGGIPKSFKSITVEIPNWCPLDDYMADVSQDIYIEILSILKQSLTEFEKADLIKKLFDKCNDDMVKLIMRHAKDKG